MQVTRIDKDEFFDGLNARIADLAEDIEDNARKIRENPDSSTYRMDNFTYPMKVLKSLQRMRDKARAFAQNEDEDLVYLEREQEGEKPRFYYLPRSQFDRSRLPEILKEMEERNQEADLGYIN